MILAAWNINSLNVRLPRLLAWLEARHPDVACLQETKIVDAKFPAAEITNAGYVAHFWGQKSYNGVAILVRAGLEASDISPGMPNYADDHKRVLTATIAGIRVICVYVPNGQSVDSEKYRYKLAWCDAAAAYLRDQLASYPKLAMLGDFNVAPDDRDVHDPALWEGQIMCSAAERAAFRSFLDAGLADSFRLFDQPPNTFSWWDYRQLAFPYNRGLRIDHILLSQPVAERCVASGIDRNARKGVRPSDHAPVLAELRDG